MNGVGGEGVFAYTDRFASHNFGQRLVEHSIALGQVAAEIAIGEDAGQFAGFVYHADAAGLSLTHDEQRVADGGALHRYWVTGTAAHDVGHLEQ